MSRIIVDRSLNDEKSDLDINSIPNSPLNSLPDSPLNQDTYLSEYDSSCELMGKKRKRCGNKKRKIGRRLLHSSKKLKDQYTEVVMADLNETEIMKYAKIFHNIFHDDEKNNCEKYEELNLTFKKHNINDNDIEKISSYHEDDEIEIAAMRLFDLDRKCVICDVLISDHDYNPMKNGRGIRCKRFWTNFRTVCCNKHGIKYTRDHYYCEDCDLSFMKLDKYANKCKSCGKKIYEKNI